jgi:hypothetical protein
LRKRIDRRTCKASVAQHGYLAVASSQWHFFEKTGRGSRWGLLLEVVDWVSSSLSLLPSSSSSGVDGVVVMGMFRDVEGMGRAVSVGSNVVRVAPGCSSSGSSGSDSSVSWGWGNAIATAARAVIRKAVRMLWVSGQRNGERNTTT